jgi:hypothetical protein
MAFLACVTDQYKQDVINGLHQPGDVYKVALYTQAGATDKNQSIATYNTTGELATANGYTQGGVTITGFTQGLSTHTAYLTFTNPSWTSSGAGFTTDCAIVYNSTRSNHVVCVVSFGSTTVSGGGVLTLTLPAAGATALVTLT